MAAVYPDTGIICLDILQKNWSPIYDVAAVLTSVQVGASEPRRRLNQLAALGHAPSGACWELCLSPLESFSGMLHDLVRTRAWAQETSLPSAWIC